MSLSVLCVYVTVKLPVIHTVGDTRHVVKKETFNMFATATQYECDRQTDERTDRHNCRSIYLALQQQRGARVI